MKAKFVIVGEETNALAKLEALKKGVLKQFTRSEDGTIEFILENLNTEEKIAAWLVAGGNLKGTGHLTYFNLSADFQKYPQGLSRHFYALETHKEKYEFIQGIAQEYDEMENVISSGNTTPYIEFG